jgi:hypothetical protein
MVLALACQMVAAWMSPDLVHIPTMTFDRSLHVKCTSLGEIEQILINLVITRIIWIIGRVKKIYSTSDLEQNNTCM